MDYKIEEIKDGKRVVIDLPLSIVSVGYSFSFYDYDTNSYETYTPGNWFVEAISDKPVKFFDVRNKQFLKYTTAVEYAKRIYVKYLKEEIKRVKGCDM